MVGGQIKLAVALVALLPLARAFHQPRCARSRRVPPAAGRRHGTARRAALMKATLGMPDEQLQVGASAAPALSPSPG